MKNKRIGHISKSMSKRYFYRKLYHLFSNAGKTGNVPEFEFNKSSFGGDRTLTPIRNNQCLGF